jgi:hypothetical protein
MMTAFEFVFGGNLAQERKIEVSSKHRDLYEAKALNSSQRTKRNCMCC